MLLDSADHSAPPPAATTAKCRILLNQHAICRVCPDCVHCVRKPASGFNETINSKHIGGAKGEGVGGRYVVYPTFNRQFLYTHSSHQFKEHIITDSLTAFVFIHINKSSLICQFQYF